MIIIEYDMRKVEPAKREDFYRKTLIERKAANMKTQSVYAIPDTYKYVARAFVNELKKAGATYRIWHGRPVFSLDEV